MVVESILMRFDWFRVFYHTFIATPFDCARDHEPIIIKFVWCNSLTDWLAWRWPPWLQSTGQVSMFHTVYLVPLVTPSRVFASSHSNWKQTCNVHRRRAWTTMHRRRWFIHWTWARREDVDKCEWVRFDVPWPTNRPAGQYILDCAYKPTRRTRWSMGQSIDF